MSWRLYHPKNFHTASLISVITWKQSVDKWINCGNIHTVEYYSLLKEIGYWPWRTWRNLKCILLSERNQSEKATYYMKDKTMEILLQRSVVARNQLWGGNKQSTENFFFSVKLFCVILNGDTFCCTFIKTQEWFLPGHSVTKTYAASAAGLVQSLVRELDPACRR